MTDARYFLVFAWDGEPSGGGNDLRMVWHDFEKAKYWAQRSANDSGWTELHIIDLADGKVLFDAIKTRHGWPWEEGRIAIEERRKGMTFQEILHETAQEYLEDQRQAVERATKSLALLREKTK